MVKPQADQIADESVAYAADVAVQHSKGVGPIISWPGYGILFFWQLGVMQYLEQTYDLSNCTMVGSSAGSMLSVLAACNVKPQAALDLAHQLCLKHRVFERPLGLLGVWGGIVREWLQTLLPDDAADRCSGRVRVVVTTLPLFQREVVTEFKDRADLIDCCLASSHVPFLLDWQATALCRGRHCVDGSMLYILTGRCHGLRPLGQLRSLLLFDPLSDKVLLRGWNMLRCVLLCGKEGAQHLLNQGLQHAAKLDATGMLSALHPYRKFLNVGDAERPPAVQGSTAGEHTGMQGGAVAAAAAVSLSTAALSSSSSSGVVSVAAVELGCVPRGEGAGSSNDSVCSEGLADAVAVIEAVCGSLNCVSD